MATESSDRRSEPLARQAIIERASRPSVHHVGSAEGRSAPAEIRQQIARNLAAKRAQPKS